MSDADRLDYDQTTQLLRTLTDVRFKLLAFVPTISGAAVALLGHSPSSAQLLSVGTLGLVATAGIVVYELRNTQLVDYARRRAVLLERRLGVGLYAEEPSGDVRLFRVVVAAHDRGLALVYGAVLGGWSYLVAWGVLHAAGAGHSRLLGGIVGALAGGLLVGEFLRFGAHAAGEPTPATAAPDAG